MGLAAQFLLRQRGLPAAADATVGAFRGKEGLCGLRRRAALDHASRSERRTGPAYSTTAQHRRSDRPSHVGALAPMVAGHLCPLLVLEGGPRSVHAPDLRKDAA